MPRNLVQAAAFLLGFAVALLLAPMNVRIARADSTDSSPFAAIEARLFEEVNAVRLRHHLIPLRRMPELDGVARGHSNDMARRNYLSHESPEGANPVHRITRGGVAGFTLAAENLGKTTHHDPTREIVQSWLASPDHRDNLLAPPFNTTGIGVARGPDGAWIYTQIYVTFPR